MTTMAIITVADTYVALTVGPHSSEHFYKLLCVDSSYQLPEKGTIIILIL